MHYRHIVFDVDGTLVDTERSEVLSLQQAIREKTGVVRPYEELKVVFGTIGRFGLKKLGYSPEEVDIIYPYWYDLSISSIGGAPVFPDVKELLDKLVDLGLALGIVTSRDRESYRLGAEPNGFARYFTTVICMEDTQCHKPHPEPLLSYIEKARAEKDRTLFVGDSAYDMQCAAAAGIDSALALWGTQDKTLPATHRLASPNDLLQIL